MSSVAPLANPLTDPQLHTALRERYPTPAALAQMVRADLAENLEDIAAPGALSERVYSLIEWVDARGERARLEQAAVWQRPPCPYPGMVPFRREQAGQFFGREAEIRQTLQALHTERAWLVIGPSGSGKSSLVAAGIVPRLQTSTFWPPDTWLVRMLRPGDRPLPALAAALAATSGTPGQVLDTVLGTHPPATRLLLVVDQLEELFTLAPRADQPRFIAALKSLAGDPRCTLLCTMRADFYPDLMDSALWPIPPTQRLEVATLRGSALREAIEGPARTAGVELEGGLVERLLGDAADEPGALPLLQETLVLLWDQMQGRLLTLSDYLTLGQDGRSGLAVALARKADTTLDTLPADKQAIARRIFLRLVQFGEGRPDTRRQQTVEELQSQTEDPARFVATLRYLADNRLLTLGGVEAERGQTVDIAHEALIAGWPVLSTWLQQQREAEIARRRLESKAAEWIRFGRGPGGLLDPVELGEAERWLAGTAAVDLGYDAAVQALITNSQAAIKEQETEKEAGRQRELAAAQTLAAEQQRVAETERDRARIAEQLAAEQQRVAKTEHRRAEEQTHAAQRLRRRAVALAGALFIALLAAGMAAWAADRAQASEQQAQAQALAAQAQAQLDSDPAGSIQMAQAAIRLSTLRQPIPLAAAEIALHQALGQMVPRLVLTTTQHPLLTGRWSPEGHRILAVNDDHTLYVWDATDGHTIITLRDPTIRAAIWSPNNQLLATLGVSNTVKIWTAASEQPAAVLTAPAPGEVEFVEWSADSQRLIAAGYDRLAENPVRGTARIWPVGGGAPLMVYTGHSDGLRVAHWSPDQRRVLTAGADGTLQIWDAQTGATLVRRETGGPIQDAEWSHDGSRVATAHEDGRVQIWASSDGQLRQTLTGHQAAVSSVRWNANDHYLLTASADKTARVWDGATGQLLTTLRGHTAALYQATWATHSDQVLTAAADGVPRIWDGPSGQLIATLASSTRDVYRALWSPDDQQILTITGDGRASLWSMAANQEYPSLVGHQAAVHTVAWNPDGTQLLTASLDRTVRLWTPDGREQRRLTATDPVTRAAWSPDGETIAAGTTTGALYLWAGTGAAARILTDSEHDQEIAALAWSPAGQWLATGSVDGTAAIWEAATGQMRFRLEGHLAPIRQVAWSPDRQWLATADEGGSIKVWNPTTGTEQITLDNTGDNGITALSWSPIGNALVSGSEDGYLTSWAIPSGVVQQRWHAHTMDISRLNWSRDGRLLLSASRDRTVGVWIWPTGQEQMRLRAFEEVIDANWNPQGDRIAAVDQSGIARIWDSASGELRTILPSSGGALQALAWSADGHRLATAATDGIVRQYAIPLADLQALIPQHTPRIVAPGGVPPTSAAPQGSITH